MIHTAGKWDYLILTAANDDQARAYRRQLRFRRESGLLTHVKTALAVPDPKGRRIGSGGSTLLCLLHVLNRELGKRPAALADPGTWEKTLQDKRILIVHAGGDSRRLPAYGPCGKILIPVPDNLESALPPVLLDRQLEVFLALPAPDTSRGQIVVTTGDVLLRFDPEEARFRSQGITALASWVDPETAARHGVFLLDKDGGVQRFMQKPSLSLQAETGALNREGKTPLDIGVMSFGAPTARTLLTLFGARPSSDGHLSWSGPLGRAVDTHGVDFYREICCALGRGTGPEDYQAALHRGGSPLGSRDRKSLFAGLSGIPFAAHILPQCEFLHFGTPRQLILDGPKLYPSKKASPPKNPLVINGTGTLPAASAEKKAWIEGCRLQAPLVLGGENIIVGCDIKAPLELPPGACVDVLPGRNRTGQRIRFVRLYGVDDTFNASPETACSFCGIPLLKWLAAVNMQPEEVFPGQDRSLWSARLFPAVPRRSDFRDWLWMFAPSRASESARLKWRKADRYSLAEIARLIDHEAFHRRRLENRIQNLEDKLPELFKTESPFSAADLSFLLKHMDADRGRHWLREILLPAAHRLTTSSTTPQLKDLEPSRILHTLGTAAADASRKQSRKDLLSGLKETLTEVETERLKSLGLDLDVPAAAWSESARKASFRHLRRTIVLSSKPLSRHPRKALRSDEIVWGRAPARLDLGGGWTDTPPYSLEYGGCVINAAVDLNGQPPIQVYARVVPEPVIWLSSIDHGMHAAIRTLDELLDYRRATSVFGLAQAALALSGFHPGRAAWPSDTRKLKTMLEAFGGGIEITTLAAIPSGSGLGTSSIMGAALIAVINRLCGRLMDRAELFSQVLRLEQELTTGGGWQDQIGGVIPGVKVITTLPGLVPDPKIRKVADSLLEPSANQEQTLLFYTGYRRLAKNILRSVVGSTLDRGHATFATLERLAAYPEAAAAALRRRDMREFGRLIDYAWELNKTIDPDSTTPEIEAILKTVRPHIFGAKLLGAGGGGFLLLIARSPSAAKKCRALLTESPPNDRSRFFDYRISREGLVVTVC